MPINQTNSALARADLRIRELREKLLGEDGYGFDIAEALPLIDLALGSLNFAGNSQQKLIDACNETERALKGSRVMQHVKAVEKCRAAVMHAEGPGID